MAPAPIVLMPHNAMRSEFYSSSSFVAQAVAISSEFNLALSVMLADHFVLRAKHDYLLSVGKITLRDTQQLDSKAEHLVSMSFLPLVSKDVALPVANQEAFAKHSSQLTKMLVRHVQSTLGQLMQRKRSLQQFEQSNESHGAVLPQNHFLVCLEQDLLTELVFTLGVISSQVSAAKGSL